MIWKFSDAYALCIVAPLTVLLIAAIIAGAWLSVVLLAADVVCGCVFWWLFSRPDFPRRRR